MKGSEVLEAMDRGFALIGNPSVLYLVNPISHTCTKVLPGVGRSLVRQGLIKFKDEKWVRTSGSHPGVNEVLSAEEAADKVPDGQLKEAAAWTETYLRVIKTRIQESEGVTAQEKNDQPKPSLGDRLLQNLDEMIKTSRPVYHDHPTMDGEYPCWTVWTPALGKIRCKNLSEIVEELVECLEEDKAAWESLRVSMSSDTEAVE